MCPLIQCSYLSNGRAIPVVGIVPGLLTPDQALDTSHPFLLRGPPNLGIPGSRYLRLRKGDASKLGPVFLALRWPRCRYSHTDDWPCRFLLLPTSWCKKSTRGSSRARYTIQIMDSGLFSPPLRRAEAFPAGRQGS